MWWDALSPSCGLLWRLQLPWCSPSPCFPTGALMRLQGLMGRALCWSCSPASNLLIASMPLIRTCLTPTHHQIFSNCSWNCSILISTYFRYCISQCLFLVLFFFPSWTLWVTSLFYFAKYLLLVQSPSQMFLVTDGSAKHLFIVFSLSFF